MKTRKCKQCNGTGMTFEKMGVRLRDLKEFMEKTPCAKCFGKGTK
ncbi:hypothetical protein [Bacillus cereus]